MYFDAHLDRLYNLNLEMVKKCGWTLKNIEKQTDELCLEAVKQSGTALQFVKEQTEEICFEAVKQNGYALEYVKEQTEELCLEAVKQNGDALKYVKDQTNKICLEAVKQNGDALYYVKEQTEELCLEAVKQNGRAINYAEKQTKILRLEAVKRCGFSLFYIKKQNKEICLEAIKQYFGAIKYVNIKYTKFIYNYLKSIQFNIVKKDDYKHLVIININPKSFKYLLENCYNDEYIWTIKYIKQNLNVCKLVLNKMYIFYYYTRYDYFSLINYKKPKLCLQIIKTYNRGFRYINKQYITNLLL